MNKIINELKSKDKIFDFIRERLAFEDGVLDSMKHTGIDKFKQDYWELNKNADLEKLLKYNNIQWESNKEHKRFIMSGYEKQTGYCTVWNMSLLNLFADLGIYDYTEYLFLDFYKGTPKIYLKYWGSGDNEEIDDLTGFGTVEIIYEIFKLTILSGKNTRRRI